ncbi:Mannan endo-1-6-alpha-mannosidase DFG5 [Apiospora kogelbergensis]|uniref:Mannan endo-1-6-alpha-mannosidase DFG5 n=1 Tax=Apiospora kogelbergensis TaxID=1337665 RepID=A0AAW0QLZ0_9PEZI
MVSSSYVIGLVSKGLVGGLSQRALTIMSEQANLLVDKQTYTLNTIAGIDALQGWYNNKTGLWDGTGWWNSANCLTVLADFAALNPQPTIDINIPDIIQKTYEQAQKTQIMAIKTLDVGHRGMVVSSYTRLAKGGRMHIRDIGKRGFDNFLNDYYDDEGWWALAMIRAHDLGVQGLGDQTYIQAANEIFEDMRKGASPCGGIYWSKVTDYTNAIANELFFSVAASLANRMKNKQYYLDVAMEQWKWFNGSGLINKDMLINDGLTADCKNNKGATWSYNQGVVLGGLAELYKATGDKSLLTAANGIATAAMKKLSVNGTLYEGCEPNCGADGAQFKGVFIRNLMYLHQVDPMPEYRTYILNNANTIWAKDRNATTNQLGVTWTGPFTTSDAGAHSSALDAMVAAVATI